MIRLLYVEKVIYENSPNKWLTKKENNWKVCVINRIFILHRDENLMWDFFRLFDTLEFFIIIIICDVKYWFWSGWWMMVSWKDQTYPGNGFLKCEFLSTWNYYFDVVGIDLMEISNLWGRVQLKNYIKNSSS